MNVLTNKKGNITRNGIYLYTLDRIVICAGAQYEYSSFVYFSQYNLVLLALYMLLQYFNSKVELVGMSSVAQHSAFIL